MRAIGNITASIAVATVAILSVSTHSPVSFNSSVRDVSYQASPAIASLSSVSSNSVDSTNPNNDVWGLIAIAAIALGSLTVSSARGQKSSEF